MPRHRGERDVAAAPNCDAAAACRERVGTRIDGGAVGEDHGRVDRRATDSAELRCNLTRLGTVDH